MTAPNIMTSTSDIDALAGNLTNNSIGNLEVTGNLTLDGYLIGGNSLVSTAAASYPVQLTDRIIIANNLGGSQNIVLPSKPAVGQSFCVKLGLATPPVIVTVDGVITIDTGTSVDLWNASAVTGSVTTTFGSSLTATWDGTQYWVTEAT